MTRISGLMLFAAAIATAVSGMAAPPEPPGYHLIKTIGAGGEGGWD
jgi:hypothetical protein